MNTGPNTGKNRKKVLIVGRMPEAGIDVLKARDDVDYEILTDDTVPSLHPKLADANAVTLGATPFRQAELDAAPGMMVVARLGVGFDAVEIPGAEQAQDPAHDDRHRQFGLRGRARDVHAAGLGAPGEEVRPVRA